MLILILINNIIALYNLKQCFSLIEKRNVLNIFFLFLLLQFCFGYVYYIDFLWFSKNTEVFEFVRKEDVNISSLIMTCIYGLSLLLISKHFNNRRGQIKTLKYTILRENISLILIPFFLIIFYLGFKYKTLAVTTVNFSLPFRLNGVIEICFNIFFPVYIYLLKIKHIWVKYSIIIFYSVIIFFSFGSKYSAFIPLITLVSMNLIIESSNFSINKRLILIAIILIPATYILINPFSVRDQIENSNKTLKERIVISYQTANLSDYDFLEKASIGTFLLSGRLAGYFTLNQSLQIADKKVSHLFQNPHKTINNHFSMKKGSLSTGFMGFFIILFNSLWIGGILGIIVIFFYAKFLLYIKNNIISLLILLITFLIFIDGPIDNFGILFKVVFSIIFLKLICFQTDLKKN